MWKYLMQTYSKSKEWQKNVSTFAGSATIAKAVLCKVYQAAAYQIHI